ncbi:MAG: hypothetical protein U0441_14420 [Polyangiaceae bacterium]
MTSNIDDPLEDPVVRAAVDHALSPYRAVLSPEAYEEMRLDLADYLAVHPVTDRLIRRLRDRANVRSGVEGGEADAPAEEAVPRRKGA